MENVIVPQENTERTLEVQAEGSLNQPTQTLDQFALFEYFNNYQPTFKDQDAMSYIVKYASDNGVNGKGELFLMLRDIESKLGTNELPRLLRIVNYLKVTSQIGDLLKVQQSYER